MRNKDMLSFKKLLSRIALLTGLAGLAACGEGDSEEGLSEKTRASWVLSLKVDGADVKLPLEGLEVYLVEDEKRPEIFQLRGPSVTLVGELPAGLHVGYEGKWERLFGKTVTILPRGGNPREPQNSQITLPGKPSFRVSGGSFVAEKTTGKAADKITIWGRVTLQVQGETGPLTLEGTFAAHAVTWG